MVNIEKKVLKVNMLASTLCMQVWYVDLIKDNFEILNF